MIEPQRWLTDDEAPAGARELLEAAPAAPPLDPRIEAQVAANITAATTGGSAASALLLKVSVGIVGAALVATAVYPLMTPPASPPPATPPATQIAPSEVETPAPEEAPTPHAAPEDRPSVVDTPSSAADEIVPAARRQVEPSPTDSLAEEAELLLEARGFAGKDPQSVLQRVRLHAARFPRGRLVAEREVLHVEALVDLGRIEEARSRAQRFERRFPRSAYLPRVHRAAPAVD